MLTRGGSAGFDLRRCGECADLVCHYVGKQAGGFSVHRNAWVPSGDGGVVCRTVCPLNDGVATPWSFSTGPTLVTVPSS